MKIAVIGSGYVGLVTGTCFAESGNIVTCVDIDERKVNMMKNGQIPIYEPGLEVLFERNIEQEKLFFTQNLKEGIEGAEVADIPIAMVPSTGEITLLQMDGLCKRDNLMKALEQVKISCEQIKEI